MSLFRKILLALSVLVFLGATIYLVAIVASVLSGGGNPDAQGLDALAVLIIVLGYGSILFGASLILGIISLILSVVIRKRGNDAGLIGPVCMITLPIATEALLAGALFILATL